MEIENLEELPEYIELMSGREVPFFRNVILELTSACNLNCIMCPRSFGRFRTTPGKRMSTEVMDIFLEEILPHVSRVDIVGDGESFLVPGLFFRLMKKTVERNVPVTACSNGQLIDAETAEKLIRYRLHDLSISIDAATEETYKRIRRADFQNLMKNIRGLKELKEKMNSERPRLHFTMVAMKMNFSELPELIRLAEKLKVEDVTVQALGEEGPEIKGESVFHHHKELFDRIYAEAEETAQKTGVKLKLWPETFNFSGKAFEEKGEGKSELYKDCCFPWETPYITTEGDVRPCCADFPAFGNVLEEDIRDIWRGSDFSKLRRALLKNHPPKVCIECPGTGWRKAAALRAALTADMDDAYFSFGFHGLEGEVRSYRWTNEKAVLFLRRAESADALIIDLAKGAFDGSPSELRITLDDGEPFHVILSDNVSQSFLLPLEESTKEIVRVEMDVPGVRRPIDVVRNSTDSRSLGVMFYSIYPFQRKFTAIFDQKIELLGCEYPSGAVNKGESFVFRAFWRFLSYPVDEEPRVFLHFYGGNYGNRFIPHHLKRAKRRRLFFQGDHDMNRPGRGSDSRNPHELIIDEIETVPPDRIDAGPYIIEMGLYESSSGRRMRVNTEEKFSRLRKSIIIGEIQIEES